MQFDRRLKSIFQLKNFFLLSSCQLSVLGFKSIEICFSLSQQLSQLLYLLSTTVQFSRLLGLAHFETKFAFFSGFFIPEISLIDLSAKNPYAFL